MKMQTPTSKVLKSEFFYSMRRITLPNITKVHTVTKDDIVKHKVSLDVTVSK